MRITVRFFAQVKAAAACPQRPLDVPDDALVGDVVRWVADEGGADLRRLLLDDQGRVHDTLLLFLGEDPVTRDDDRPLRNGDVLDIMSPISGG